MCKRLSKEEVVYRFQKLRNMERMYKAARDRISELLKKTSELNKEKEELQRKLDETQNKLKKEQDQNQKLRELLFVRKEPRTRTNREKEPVQRNKQSYQRPTPKPTEYKTLSLKQCPNCSHQVSLMQSSYTRLIEDIVFNPVPVATEWTIERHFCSHCQKLVSGTVPGILPGFRLGPNVMNFVVLAKYRWNQPYEKIQDQLLICFGLHVSDGEIANLIDTVSKLMKEKWQTIIEAVRTGKLVHCDETGWFVDGKKVWAHTFANNEAVLYEIIPTRGKQVVENALKGFNGTRVTDCLPNYRNLSGDHQICWEHLTREAYENKERDKKNQEKSYLSEKFDQIYALIRIATKDFELTEATRTKQKCEAMVKDLADRQWNDQKCRNLVKRLETFRHALFTCLTKPGIPPDNNHAERVLRKLAIQRKISGGNRSSAHAQHHARIMSVMETLRLEGGDLLPKLQAVLQSGIALRLSSG